MAKVTGGLDRALLKYPDLDLDKVRLIGWGRERDMERLPCIRSAQILPHAARAPNERTL
jgi:hypothetical protein